MHHEYYPIYMHFFKKQPKNNVVENTGKAYRCKEYGLFWLHYKEFITALYK